MSARNGDKARFGRLRRQKILRRMHIREMRVLTEDMAARAAIAVPK